MDQPLGIYYAFLATSDTVDWFDCLRRTKAAGLDVLEMSAPKLRGLSAADRKGISARAKDLGLTLSLATALSPDADVSSDDAAIHSAGTRLLMEDVKLAHEVGALSLGGILTGVGKAFPEGIEHTRQHAVDNAIRSLREVAKAAEELGVNLGAEVVNRFESPLVNTCEECLRVAEAVDSPCLGVHLDTFHMNIEEADPAAAIRLAGKRLIHFHACENNRSLPGHGHIDWNGIFDALHDIRYSGMIVMESLPGPYGTVSGRLNIWRKLSQDTDGELKQAADFLRALEAARP